MIAKETLGFLKKLEKNNNREWFQENKKLYEAANRDFTDFITALIGGVASFDDSLTGTMAKDCTFRIFRDVRFSKDKSPYKTNFGAYMAQGGRKSMQPGYYLHFDSKECFVAGGAYMPEPAALLKIRQAIAENTREFFAIIKDKGFTNAFGGLSPHDAPLKNPPKGFPKEHEAMQYLKYKHFIASCNLSPEEIGDPTIAAGFFKLMLPLNEFLRKAIAR